MYWKKAQTLVALYVCVCVCVYIYIYMYIYIYIHRMERRQNGIDIHTRFDEVLNNIAKRSYNIVTL